MANINLESIWDNIFLNQAWGQYPGEELIRFIARNFYSERNRSAVRILEIGCGPGANLWFLCREGFSFVGVDISASAIDLATRRLDKEFPNWNASSTLYVGNTELLPLEQNSVDAVIDNECVYCNSFNSAKRIYEEAFRVLKPRGKLFVRTFANGSWGDGTGQKLQDGRWECDTGPLAGKGPSRFTHNREIQELLETFRVSNIELLTRTQGNMSSEIKEWIITAEKPG